MHEMKIKNPFRLRLCSMAVAVAAAAMEVVVMVVSWMRNRTASISCYITHTHTQLKYHKFMTLFLQMRNYAMDALSSFGEPCDLKIRLFSLPIIHTFVRPFHSPFPFGRSFDQNAEKLAPKTMRLCASHKKSAPTQKWSQTKKITKS